MNGAMSVGTNHKPVTCFDINNLAVNVELALAAQNAINFFILLMAWTKGTAAFGGSSLIEISQPVRPS